MGVVTAIMLENNTSAGTSTSLMGSQLSILSIDNSPGLVSLVNIRIEHLAARLQTRVANDISN